MRKFLPRRFAAVAIGLALACTLAASAWAANNAGQLDTSFGGTGYVTTSFGPGTFAFGQSASVQGDKTVAVGGVFGTDGDFALARYNKNGSLDTSFGNGGLVTTGFTPGSDDLADAVTTMGDKILVAGYTSPDFVNFEFALARYNKDGSLDMSFGNGGKVVTSFGDGYDFADAVTVKGDKIIAAGEAGPQGSEDFALAQYTKNGTLDASFGAGGLVRTDFNGGFDSANGVALQGDNIVAAGYVTSPTGGFDFGLARYTKSGALDGSFGTGGKVETDFFGGDDVGHAIDVKGDRIVVIGDVQNGSRTVGTSTYILHDFGAAMYDKKGALDPKFGTGGKAVLSAGDVDQGYAGGFGPGDSVFVIGSTEDYPALDPSYFAVGRWTKNGTPDPKFGTNGTTRNTIGGDSAAAFGGTLGPDDKITAVGTHIETGELAVARYTDNG